MKCLETESLISYAYNLIDEPAASQVRAHLQECPHCREIVGQLGGLDAVLREWKAPEPTPEFDARARQNVEAEQAARAGRNFWSWQWARGLTLAALGVLITVGAVWLMRSHRAVSVSSPVAVHPPQRANGSQAPEQATNRQPPAAPTHVGVKLNPTAPRAESAAAPSYEDNDAQALEDYDLAANFDVLSELPKAQPQRVAN